MTRLEFAMRLGLLGLLVFPSFLAVVVYRLVTSVSGELLPSVALKLAPSASLRTVPTRAFALGEHPLLDETSNVGKASTGRRERFGYCTEAQASRGRMVGWYSATPAERSTIYVARGVVRGADSAVHDHLAEIRSHLSETLGLSADPPDIYLHRSAAILRFATCSGPSTVALYDGAIHVSTEWNGPHGTEELLASIRHEYVHHVLFRNSLRGPWWLQEGAAMHIGGDSPPGPRLQGRALSPEAMTSPPLASTKPEQLELLYTQAYSMLSFLEEICRSSEEHAAPVSQNPLRCAGRQLVSALRSGTSPNDLFWWAATRWHRHDARSAWSSYVANH